MASRASQPSQVSLFNAQVAEQLQRLRSLTGSVDAGGSEVVALKRAVMATRLLAGSARILQLDALHTFLERLLQWLQQVEGGRKSLTTSQSMLLESVIDLEERIMRHLEAENGSLDLTEYADEIGDLQQLIERHFAERSRPAQPQEQAEPEATSANPAEGDQPQHSHHDRPPRERHARGGSKGPRPADEPASKGEDAAAHEAAAPGQGPARRVAAHLVEALSAVTESVEALAATGGGTDLPRGFTGHLFELNRRLQTALERLNGTFGSEVGAVAPASRNRRPSSPRATRGSIAQAALHPMLEPLRERLAGYEHMLGVPIGIDVTVIGRGVPAGVEDVMIDIIGHLLDDVVAAFREGVDAGAAAPPTLEVNLDLTEDQGRMLISISDNAPPHPDGGALDESDHLVRYRGLRHARTLVEQLNGLIWVEPSQAPQSRFILSLPMDLRDQTYRVIDLGQVQVAVPWVLVDDIMPTEGLMFHADATGESFHAYGHSIALVDLAAYVPSLIPRDDPAEHIAIVGSVEKRLGIFCEGVGDLVDATAIAAPPPGWERVAYGSLELAGDRVPLLEIGRILRLRFGAEGPELRDVAGSADDTMIDSYVPVEDDAEPAPAPEPPPTPPEAPVEPSGKRRALLINQSDFRRRDLARTLEAMGFEVMATAELVRGLHYLEQQRVALIVTDLRLGDQGLESLTRLRDGQLDAPLVLTSSVAREYAEELARKTGADACWLDPFRPADLESILATLA